MNITSESSLIRQAKNTLTVLDYIIIFCSLFFASFIGVYFGILRPRTTNNLEGYFLGGRKMGLLPVTMSLLSTFFSAIVMLGGPGEVYSQTGIMNSYSGLGVGIGVILAGFTFQPLMYKKKITTTFEVNPLYPIFYHFK